MHMQITVHSTRGNVCHRTKDTRAFNNDGDRKVQQVLYRRWKDGLASMVAPSGE